MNSQKGTLFPKIKQLLSNVTTGADQPTLPVPPQACRHGSGHMCIESMFDSPSWMTSTSEEPQKRSRQNDCDKTIATPQQNDRDKTTVTKRSVGLGLPRHCELLFKLFTVMNMTTSFLPTQMYFRAEWLSEINKFAVISVSLEIFGKRPRREKESNLMGDFVTPS